MKTKGAAPEVLTAELRTLLLYGPWELGKTLNDLPPHDDLRATWKRHGATLQASLKPGQRAWFVTRDAFVRVVRGEAPCD